jgi:hypothetical protein
VFAVSLISLKSENNKLFLENGKIEERSHLQFQQLEKLYNSFGDIFSKELFVAVLDKSLNDSIVPIIKIMLSPEFERFMSDLSSGAKDEAISNIIDYLKRRKKVGGRGVFFGKARWIFLRIFAPY